MSFSADRLEFAIFPSRAHCILLALVHALALVALALSGVEVWLAGALGLAVVSSFAWSLRRYGLLKDPHSVMRLALAEGEFRLTLRSGETVTANLESNVVVLGWLVVLNFRQQGARFPVALFSDSADADALRQLRVLLKFGYPKRGGTR